MTSVAQLQHPKNEERAAAVWIVTFVKAYRTVLEYSTTKEDMSRKSKSSLRSLQNSMPGYGGGNLTNIANVDRNTKENERATVES